MDKQSLSLRDKDSTLSLHTGSKIPILGLGTWQLNENTADVIALAIKLGYKMIDTSSDYGTQPGVGEGIKKSGAERESLYIITKVEETDDAYERTKSNLAELNLDYVDLMLIHRPPPNGAGEELWEGLIKAKKEGLIKDIGVSNYSTDLIDKLIETTGEVPTVNQIEWSPFGYSEEMLKYCSGKKIIIQAYSPITRNQKLDQKVLDEIAEKYQKSPAQILLRWNLQIETVPLPKASSEEHLKENLDLFDFDISGEDMRRLSDLNEHYSSLGNLPYL